MINSEPQSPPSPDDNAVERIVAEGPGGALTIAGIATVIVVGIWLAFYLFVFLPRGPLQ
jgi:hypothetical protein